jgi:hypothetical protein
MDTTNGRLQAGSGLFGAVKQGLLRPIAEVHAP